MDKQKKRTGSRMKMQQLVEVTSHEIEQCTVKFVHQGTEQTMKSQS